MFSIDNAMDFLREIWSYDSLYAKCYAVVWIKKRIGYRHFCLSTYRGYDGLYDAVKTWLEKNLPWLTRSKYHVYYQVLPLSMKPPKGRGGEKLVKIGKWLWCDLDYKKEVFTIELPDELREDALKNGYAYIEREDHGLYGVYRKEGSRSIWILVDRPPLNQVIDNVMKLLGFKPTIVVDSGNGYHLYFKLSEEIKSRDLKDLETYIVNKLDGDPQTKDLARILRIPGTINPRNNRMSRTIYRSNTVIDPWELFSTRMF
ncbi:MAG: hypothetical protein DRO40_11770 [Thermoprotei archaeon]|mgnify:CR=1 FL=1|nr:MAG: hypothetical protein DRO40_11770 [Thermoprotei archaeon]